MPVRAESPFHPDAASNSRQPNQHRRCEAIPTQANGLGCSDKSQSGLKARSILTLRPTSRQPNQHRRCEAIPAQANGLGCSDKSQSGLKARSILTLRPTSRQPNQHRRCEGCSDKSQSGLKARSILTLRPTAVNLSSTEGARLYQPRPTAWVAVIKASQG
jgi:hypothetical protein